MFVNVRAASFLVVLLVAIFAVTGCQRQRAENSLKKTRQKLSDIDLNYGGYEHAPDQMEQIQQLIERANGQLTTDAGAALDLAKQASAQADQLLEEVKPQQAEQLFSTAQNEIRVADINDLPRREPERYSRIRELKTQADAAKSNNEWDEVIQLSQQIIDEVETGLAGLRNDVDRRSIDADQALTNLTKIGGNIYAPEVVIAVRTQIDLAEQIADEDRDYVLAATKFSEAKNRAEQGIIEVLREKSRESIEEIEGYLTEALLEGAKQFKNEDYQSANRLFESVLVDYREGRYNAVIEASKLLLERSQNLVIETKRAASDDRIATMQENIQELDQGGIQEYLPGALADLREQLARAREIRQQDTEEAFDQIKEISIEAADEYDRQRNRFQQLALDAIRDARNSLETSRAVFDRMDDIFEPVSGEMSEEQRAFENQKETRRVELGQRLEEANNNLVTADLRQQQGEFRGAIELANQVRQSSENVLSEIYHTVAHNASIELAKLISRYERDGARQYASEELQRATQKLEQVKQSVDQGNYKTAVEQAAEARADVELMAQSISGRATENLREARRTLDSASSEKTRRYRAEKLDRVQELIEQAEQNLQEERLKIALETAQRATELALNAEREANMEAADEQIQEAASAITRAQDAGAGVYASREVEDSRRLLASSRTLFQTGEYVRAEELAMSSQQRAQNALYKKINQAEADIANAKAVNAWDYNYDSLANAIAKVREARQLIQNGQYDESAKLAESAERTAYKLTQNAKRKNFDQRVARIRENLEIGTKEGLNFFQPEESKEVRRRLVELQDNYSPDDYERIMSEVERLEGKLRITLDGTDGLVTQVAAQLEERLDNLEDAGAVHYATAELARARQSLELARLDYRRDYYKSAHSNLDDAIDLTRKIESRQAEMEYASEIQQLFDDYDRLQDQFSNVLTLNPQELKALAVGVNGSSRMVSISSQITPNEFRAGVDELFSRALVLEVPKGIENFHESVIKAFAEGRVAANNFEKLVILNRVAREEAFALIDQAYYHLRVSNEMIADIQRKVVSDEIRFRLVSSGAGEIVNAYD